MKLPKIGDVIYVPTILFICHGGRAKVKAVRVDRRKRHHISFDEFPDELSWEKYFRYRRPRDQLALKKQYGTERACQINLM